MDLDWTAFTSVEFWRYENRGVKPQKVKASSYIKFPTIYYRMTTGIQEAQQKIADHFGRGVSRGSITTHYSLHQNSFIPNFIYILVALAQVTWQRFKLEYIYLQQKKNSDIFDLRITEKLISTRVWSVSHISFCWPANARKRWASNLGESERQNLDGQFLQNHQ